MFKPRCLAVIVLLVSAGAAHADVRLPSIIGSNMVLQQGKPVPIWGWAQAGEKVTVAIPGQTKSTQADNEGRWMVKLDALTAKPNQKPITLTVSGKNKIELTNILVGEVWVCSGQSNMAWTVNRSNDADIEAMAARWPNIRLITVPRASKETPQDDFEGQWVACNPESAPNFSAVGYYFGRQLHQTLGVPVGLINTSYGGTPSEAWTRLEAIQAKANLKPLLDRWDEQISRWDQAKADAHYQKQLAKWKEAVTKAKKAGKQGPRRPRAPRNPATSSHRPAGLYNAMIHPVIPFAARGAIWYQGESNASRAQQYRTVFPTMIENWRTDWGKQGSGDLSFYWVQLANFLPIKDEPADSAWAELREAQSMTLKLPNTGEAVIIDIGQARDIHPTNKQDVGKRLARWALARDYGKDIVYSGPRFKQLDVKGAKATVTFDHIGGGLRTYDRQPLQGFAIVGENKKWVWAQGRVVGKDKVELWSDQVKKPVAVRYAWADNPQCNLYNSAGLPASPFRTDDWPMVTADKH